MAQAGSRRPWRWLKDPLINDCLRQADAAVMVAGKDREHFLANRSFGEMVEKGEMTAELHRIRAEAIRRSEASGEPVRL